MIGLIQDVLLRMVEDLGGAAALAEVRRRAEIPVERQRFRLDTDYSDSEFQRLFVAACEVLSVTPEQGIDAFAVAFHQDSLRRFPMWFEMSPNARSFLARQSVIHNCFASGQRDPATRSAIEDKFRVDDSGEDLIIYYRSPNKLCRLNTALARLALEHYGETATLEETRCTQRGDRECELHIRWNASSNEHNEPAQPSTHA